MDDQPSERKITFKRMLLYPMHWLGIGALLYWLVIFGVNCFYLARCQPMPTIDVLDFFPAFVVTPLVLLVLLVSAIVSAVCRRRVWVGTVVLMVLLLATAAVYETCIWHFRTTALEAAFHRMPEVAKPLTDALEAYRRDHHGTPPPSLEALIPAYLPALPTTGMHFFSTYRYDIYQGHWLLFVDCPLEIGPLSRFACVQPDMADVGSYVGEFWTVKDRNWYFVRE
jgi:hypothetical protein